MSSTVQDLTFCLLCILKCLPSHPCMTGDGQGNVPCPAGYNSPSVGSTHLRHHHQHCILPRAPQSRPLSQMGRGHKVQPGVCSCDHRGHWGQHLPRTAWSIICHQCWGQQHDAEGSCCACHGCWNRHRDLLQWEKEALALMSNFSPLTMTVVHQTGMEQLVSASEAQQSAKLHTRL